MRESRTYGSVRGALSNERPYRDRPCTVPTVRAGRVSFRIVLVGTSSGAPTRAG
jgi:hypothetical protein